jgi:hypothetical protein
VRSCSRAPRRDFPHAKALDLDFLPNLLALAEEVIEQAAGAGATIYAFSFTVNSATLRRQKHSD